LIDVIDNKGQAIRSEGLRDYGEALNCAGVTGKAVEKLEVSEVGQIREGKLTLTALPAALYSRSKGTTCSASIKVETMMLTGPRPPPTCNLVSSVVC
jgi:hypothetical protein